jgi:hypothetical protein
MLGRVFPDDPSRVEPAGMSVAKRAVASPPRGWISASDWHCPRGPAALSALASDDFRKRETLLRLLVRSDDYRWRNKSPDMVYYQQKRLLADHI